MGSVKPQVIWRVTDPTPKRRPVILTRSGYEHIVGHHPELEPHIESLSTIIEQPVMILADKFDADTNLFCSKASDIGASGDLWLRVVAQFDISDSGEVTTAYLSSGVPNGDIIWLRPNIKI